MKKKPKEIKIKTVNDPVPKETFWDTLSKKEKEWIFDLQNKLFDEGFGKDKDFVQKECREEAIKRFKSNGR